MRKPPQRPIEAHAMAIKPALLTLLLLIIFYLHADGYSGEKVVYAISPIGQAEYDDLGLVELGGKKVKLVTFKTKVLWFEDTEKIYAEPDTLLPLKIERKVTSWFGKESIVEEYDQKNFTLTLIKLRNNKKVSTQIVKEKGPIQNAVLLTFFPRLQPRLDIGWKFLIRIPAQYEVKLVSIDEVTVPAGRCKAYHFTSTPDKFELWVSEENPRIPVKIRGKGGLAYTLVMKRYTAMKEK